MFHLTPVQIDLKPLQAEVDLHRPPDSIEGIRDFFEQKLWALENAHQMLRHNASGSLEIEVLKQEMQDQIDHCNGALNIISTVE